MTQWIAVTAAAAFVGGSSTVLSAANVLLFADDFSNGSVAAPAGVNAPDPRFDVPNTTVTIADNTSVTGTIPASFGPDDLVYTGHGGGFYDEKGGFMEFGTTISARGALQLRDSTMALATHVQDGQLSLFFDDVNPIVGGGGGTQNWFAWSLANTGANIGQGNVKVNAGDVVIGSLFRDNGGAVVFSGGANLGSPTYDAAASGGTYDFRVDLTNMTATSLDYDILVNGNSVIDGSVTGVDTSVLILTIETTGSPSTIGRLAIETAPEPASVALLGLGGLAMLRRRRRRN